MFCFMTILIVMEKIGKIQVEDMCNTQFSVTKAVLGQNVDLTCLKNSSALLWEKETTILFSNGEISDLNTYQERLKPLNGGQLLRILQTGKNDSGLYECYGGNDTRKYKQRLKVLDKPVVEVDYERQELYCNASDWLDMTVVFTWEHLSKFKEHIRYLDKSENAILSLNGSRFDYLIDGQYSCTVESTVNDGSKNLSAVSRAVTFELSGEPVCIGDMSEIMYGKEGDNITLQQFVYGDLENEENITWLHGNRTVNITDDKFELSIGKTNRTIQVYDNIILLEVYLFNLTVYGLVEEDFGTYTINILGNRTCVVQLDPCPDIKELSTSTSTPTASKEQKKHVPVVLLYIYICAAIMGALLITAAIYSFYKRVYLNTKKTTRPSEVASRQELEMTQLPRNESTPDDTVECHLSHHYSTVRDSLQNETYVFTEILDIDHE